MASYLRLNRKAAAGVDGQVWRSWSGEVNRRSLELARELRAGEYTPSPLRRVALRKHGGGSRPLRVPCLRDKVVQGAVASELLAAFGSSFRECDLAFGPRRRNAVAKSGAWSDGKGGRWVLRADIEACFSNVPRAAVLAAVRRRFDDVRFVRLVSELFSGEVGLPQGGVASPVLCGIFLARAVDAWVFEYRRNGEGPVVFERYVDDIAATFKSEADAWVFSVALSCRLSRFGMSLRSDKTRVVDVRSERVDFLGMRHDGRMSRPAFVSRFAGMSRISFEASIRHYRKSCSRRELSLSRHIGSRS